MLWQSRYSLNWGNLLPIFSSELSTRQKSRVWLSIFIALPSHWFCKCNQRLCGISVSAVFQVVSGGRMLSSRVPPYVHSDILTLPPSPLTVVYSLWGVTAWTQRVHPAHDKIGSAVLLPLWAGTLLKCSHQLQYRIEIHRQKSNNKNITRAARLRAPLRARLYNILNEKTQGTTANKLISSSAFTNLNGCVHVAQEKAKSEMKTSLRTFQR